MQEQLFTQALGLTSPWAVDSVSFRPDEGAIHFEVSCKAARLACPACGAADQPVHDRMARSWQHLHFFQFKAFIHCQVPRVACTQCGKTSQTPVPWAAKGSGFSALLEAFVVTMCASLPVAHVAKLLGVSDDRIGAWCGARWMLPGPGRTSRMCVGSGLTRPPAVAATAT